MMVKSFFKYLLLIGLAALFTVSTVILGALPMLAIRRTFGRWPYWVGLFVSACALAVAGMQAFGLMVFALMVMVGVFAEIEEHGGSLFMSSFVAISMSIGASAVAGGIWLMKTRLQLLTHLRESLEPVVDQLVSMSATSAITVDTVIQQMPSGIVIALMGALAIALIGDGRFFARSGQKDGSRNEERLATFHVPDAFLWLTIVALLGAFLKHEITWLEIVSVNVINVMIVTYFMQGLSITSAAFRTFKVGPVWQGIWYVLLILQLFLLVAMLGFADFWLDFRERLARREAEANKGF